MSSIKDLYFDLMVQKMNDLEDQGMDPDKAYEIAGDRAYKDFDDHLADLADREKLRRKEGR